MCLVPDALINGAVPCSMVLGCAGGANARKTVPYGAVIALFAYTRRPDMAVIFSCSITAFLSGPALLFRHSCLLGDRIASNYRI